MRVKSSMPYTDAHYTFHDYHSQAQNKCYYTDRRIFVYYQRSQYTYRITTEVDSQIQYLTSFVHWIAVSARIIHALAGLTPQRLLHTVDKLDIPFYDFNPQRSQILTSFWRPQQEGDIKTCHQRITCSHWTICQYEHSSVLTSCVMCQYSELFICFDVSNASGN